MSTSSLYFNLFHHLNSLVTVVLRGFVCTVSSGKTLWWEEGKAKRQHLAFNPFLAGGFLLPVLVPPKNDLKVSLSKQKSLS